MADTVMDLAAAVRRGDVSPRELVDDALGRIEERDGELNCFVALDPARARAEAGAIEERVRAGDRVGPNTRLSVSA